MNKLSRRRFVGTTLAAGTGAVIMPSPFTSPLMAQPKGSITEPSLKGKKVLYVYGGWEGHDPKPSVDLFVPWMRSEGAEVVVSDTLDSYLDVKLMESRDLIVQIWTMGTITNEQEAGLLKAVKNGAGLAGWHGGIGDSFRNNVEYQFMVGGQWVAHPGGVIGYSVQITNHEDPVTKGLKDFNMHSEQYYMHIDPNVKVLATTKFNGDHAPWIDAIRS
ncbi:MAG TPA: ThuA domain-containing protein, partial [Prolixibacteraceae bacterium]|nr:ThuA domain-containing protein [Prolixibacteraceae bacterium]